MSSLRQSHNSYFQNDVITKMLFLKLYFKVQVFYLCSIAQVIFKAFYTEIVKVKHINKPGVHIKTL